MPRPFRLFREYDFFGILMPGLASVIFLYLLLPKDINVGLPSGIVFVSVFGFVFGQALHAVALAIDTFPTTLSQFFVPPWSHRRRFMRYLNEPPESARGTIRRFRRRVAAECPGVEYHSDFNKASYNYTEAVTVYTFVRSYLHNQDHTRSSGIKAMYAFCRNMLVLLSGLVPLYIIYGVLSTQASFGVLNAGFIDRVGKYDIYFPNYVEFLKAVIPLTLLGAVLFGVGTFLYQRFYVQYLFSDFLTVAEERDGSPLPSFDD